MPSKSSKPLKRSTPAVEEDASSSSSDPRFNVPEDDSVSDRSELDASHDEGSLEDDLASGEEAEELEFDLEDEDGMENKRMSLEDLIARAKSDKADEEVANASGKAKNKGKGVVYIARIPPAMTQHQLRSLLSPYGEIGRIWIETPESISQDRTLSKGKANKLARKMSKEGWVEFERAKKAYRTAKLLHTQAIGVGRFKHDLWSIKYLKDFSWNDLVNQHLHRKKMREERLRQSISRAKREANKFMENRHKQDSLENKKKRKRIPDEPVQARPINMDEPSAPPSSSGLLANDLLSKARPFCTVFTTIYVSKEAILTRLFYFLIVFSFSVVLRNPAQRNQNLSNIV